MSLGSTLVSILKSSELRDVAGKIASDCCGSQAHFYSLSPEGEVMLVPILAEVGDVIAHLQIALFPLLSFTR